ncbi:phage tail protein (plasmid) [Streptomyces sp. QH1-20]|uniref:phage tail protein n=1 Tax=Streptomyces sp. QH1-20 TaxID=3240934 RepID=UPI003515F957
MGRPDGRSLTRSRGTTLSKDAQPLPTHRFQLSFHGPKGEICDDFTGCTGLAMSMEVDEVIEGGHNTSPTYLNTRIKYTPLTVSRLVSKDTLQMCKWVQDNLTNPDPKPGYVAILGPDEKKVASWELLDLRPVAWRGPTLNTSTSTCAVEEIDFVHGGFYFGDTPK